MKTVYTGLGLGLTLVLTTVGYCDAPANPGASPTPTTAEGRDTPSIEADLPLWQGEFTEDWRDRWQVRSQGAWGDENLQIRPDDTGQFDQVLRVSYPAGSVTPSFSRETGSPIGGAQFYADLGIAPQEGLRLNYSVRFADGFDFVKGGKLPGLFGGDGASGGRIPDGTDGFSTRLMWRRQGAGEVYAYLPTSQDYGTSIGRGNWQFQPGVWHQIQQEVRLNHPGQADGWIRLWVDGALVVEQTGLTFRTVDTLQINGLFFSTFFGGSDRSWATPETVYADFAGFSVAPLDPQSASPAE